MKLAVFPLVLGLLAATSGGPQAQEAGNARQGRALAQAVCAACHAIEKGRPSPNTNAPTFEAIASLRGMSARALVVALRTSHRTMPNLMLADDDMRNVIAYILSLR